MTIKDFLFAVINFVILFGALFLITRKMIVRMFKERKEKIAQDLEQSHQADLESQRLSTDVAQARDQARQQEDALLAETRAQVERSSREAEKLRTEEADALRRNAIQTEKQLRRQMHGQVSAQVIRQVASQAGETLKTSTFAPERQALVERYIEQVKEVLAAMPSDILNMNELKKLNISIASPEPLTDEEMKKVTQILCETFLSVRNEVDDGLVGGVRMQVGDTVYDGTLAHQLDRLSQEVEFNSRMDDQEELSVLESIREKLSGTDNSIDVYQTGKVISVSDGICHVYVDRHADISMAVKVAVDSKTQNVSVCNAMETLLVHRDIAEAFLPPLCAAMTAKGVELRGDETTQKIIHCEPADWDTEYLDLILSIRVVDSLADAITHINRHGSHHTDCIVTSDDAAASEFMYAVILKTQLGVGVKSEVRVKAEGLALQFGQFGVSVAVVVVALACACLSVGIYASLVVVGNQRHVSGRYVIERVGTSQGCRIAYGLLCDDIDGSADG